MKATFYYLFGIVTMLYAFAILFDLYAPTYLDDYYVDLLVQNYSREWYSINIGIAVTTILFALIWVYNLGKGNNKSNNEPLLKPKEDE